MLKRIPKRNLGRLLAQRENYGCHPGLGRVGKVARFSRSRQSSGPPVYRCGVQFGEEPPEMVLISQDELLRRQILRHNEALEPGAPAFVLDPGGPYKRYAMLFLAIPEEVLLLLRLNLEHLRRLDDAKSQALLREFTGLTRAAIPPSDNLCLQLVELRGSSHEKFLELLEALPSRRAGLEAADRGEVLSITKSCGSVASELGEHDLHTLRNVVRSHYISKVRELRREGVGLSALGQKVFGQMPVSELSRGERQAILTMALLVASGRNKEDRGRESRRFFLR